MRRIVHSSLCVCARVAVSMRLVQRYVTKVRTAASRGRNDDQSALISSHLAQLNRRYVIDLVHRRPETRRQGCNEENAECTIMLRKTYGGRAMLARHSTWP